MLAFGYEHEFDSVPGRFVAIIDEKWGWDCHLPIAWCKLPDVPEEFGI